MTTKKKKKKIKYRLKSSVKRFLIYFIFFVGVGIYAFSESLKIVDEFKYRETYEYKLTEINYSLDEAKKIIEILPPEKIDEILKKEYDETITKIITEKYFLLKNFDRYVEYKKSHEETSYSDIIAIINVNASAGWYTEIRPSDTSKEYLLIVNKFYNLEPDYKRIDLKNINLAYAYDDNQAAEIVIENFENMKNDLEKEIDVHLMINSSYRNYQDQEEIYNNYKMVSFNYAEKYAARPGHSEHQTGLAIDITSLEHPGAKAFTESDEYAWLVNNCYKYGFILRYPPGKEYLTGFSNESWHFRYVGKDAATIIHNENITFDEYYAYYIEK